MNRSLLKFHLIFALSVSACNAREEPAEQMPPATAPGETQAAPGSAAADPSIVHHPEPPQRPQEKPDSIQVEGSYQRFTARLVQPPTSIPFSTYLPEDMTFESTSTAEGEAFYFYTNFAGRRNDDAFMVVVILPQGKTQADARAQADALIARRSGRQVVANAQIGEHHGRYFYLAQVYPAEYGDGMGPRTHYIRSQWVWLNDGQSLAATLQPRRE